MIAAYGEPDRTRGRALMVKLIESLSHGVPDYTFDCEEPVIPSARHQPC